MKSKDNKLSEFEDFELIEEIEDRKYFVFEEREIQDNLQSVPLNVIARYLSDLPPYELKEFLCDLAEVNHHSDLEKVLSIIKQKAN